ncbi:MAG: hypothetical protein ACPG45_02990 [Flavobacteriaceae bacterium]
MMKTIKKITKLGILLFGISLILVNCQKDDSVITNTEVQQKPILQKISLETLQLKMGTSESYNKISSFFDINKKNTTTNKLSEGSNATLDTSNIYLSEKEDYNYYTFGINNAEIELFEFYNLIVTTDKDNNLVRSEILEYQTENFWDSESGTPFVGNIKSSPNTLFPLSEMFSSKIGDDCITGVSGHWQCDDGGTGDQHGPDQTANSPCTGSIYTYVINVVTAPCPESLDPGDSTSGGITGDDTNPDSTNSGPSGTSSSNTDNTTTGTNPDDTSSDTTGFEDLDGNEITTTPTPPRSSDDEPCSSLLAVMNLTSTLQLNDNQAGCLSDPNNCEKTTELDLYMQSNPLEIEFGQLATNAICADYEVDYEKKIIYEITDPCQLKIVKEAFNNTSALTQTVKNVFTGTDTNYSYKIRDSIIPNNSFGGTRAAATDALPTCVTGDCTFTTTLNTWILSGGDPSRPLWGGATDLSIAKTVIHESLHALLSYLLDAGAISTTDPDPDLAKLAEAYALHQAINNSSSGIPLAQLQHEYMVSLVNDVATALQQVGQNLGYTNNFDFYRKLAWSGSLEHADAFPVEFNALDEEEAIAIGKTELYNSSHSYNGVDAFGNAIGLSTSPKGEPANSSNSNCN